MTISFLSKRERKCKRISNCKTEETNRHCSQRTMHQVQTTPSIRDYTLVVNWNNFVRKLYDKTKLMKINWHLKVKQKQTNLLSHENKKSCIKPQGKLTGYSFTYI